MIKVPVLLDFDSNKVIGSIEVEEKLLPRIPNFVFSLGYRVNKVDDFTNIVTDYDLICISVIDDEGYVKYLKNEGRFNE
jgi:hypothetical protein